MRKVTLFLAVTILATGAATTFAESTPSPAPSASANAKPAKYTCPMHPDVAQDKPGKCDKCGMALVPKEEKPKG
jgi:hypothetical protein